MILHAFELRPANWQCVNAAAFTAALNTDSCVDSAHSASREHYCPSAFPWRRVSQPHRTTTTGKHLWLFSFHRSATRQTVFGSLLATLTSPALHSRHAASTCIFMYNSTPSFEHSHILNRLVRSGFNSTISNNIANGCDWLRIYLFITFTTFMHSCKLCGSWSTWVPKKSVYCEHKNMFKIVIN